MNLVVRSPHFLRVETSVRAALAAGVVALVVLIAGGTWAAKQGMDARAARQEACAAKIQAFTARNPVLAKGLHMQRYDACVDWRAMSGDEP